MYYKYCTILYYVISHYIHITYHYVTITLYYIILYCVIL